MSVSLTPHSNTVCISVSDQYEDLPDTLLHIQARLESVETNQSQVLVSINKIFQSVSELETKLQVLRTFQ